MFLLVVVEMPSLHSSREAKLQTAAATSRTAEEPPRAPTQPPSPGTRPRSHPHILPAKRSPLLLGAVFHVTSTLLRKNAGCDGGDGGKLHEKVHFCRPAGGLQRELSPPLLDISIIDVL